MFSLSLVALHNASSKTFHVKLDSLPCVTDLLEDMGGFLEQKYGIKFPEIPDIFYAVDSPPDANVDLPSSPACPLPPKTPVVRVAPVIIERAPTSTTSALRVTDLGGF